MDRIAIPDEAEWVSRLTGEIYDAALDPTRWEGVLEASCTFLQGMAASLGSFSTRADVPPPDGFKPLTSYKIANNYREFMTNDKLVADLRKRFEGYTGPPANKGGVR